MTRTLSVAHLTALDLQPSKFIEAAAEAGFDAVGLRLLKVTSDSPGYPLMERPNDMRATLAAIRDTGVSVSDIEFIRITPDVDLPALFPLLDAGAQLGAQQVITAPYDTELSRLSDRLGQLSEAAKTRGLNVVLEFFPWTSVPDLTTCWRVVQQSGPNTGILVDSLHFDRSGSSHEELACIPASRLPFAHLSDALVQSTYTEEELLRTARSDRLPPGEGEIGLADLLQSLPSDIPLGIEVPMLDNRINTAPVETLRHLRNATNSLLGSLQS